MRTAVSRLTMISPRSPAAALRALRDDPGLVPIAGATDLYVSFNDGTLEGERFLDLWPLTALSRITHRDGVLSIGALATYSRIIRSRHVQREIPILVEAARQVGGVQIQNRGTIGGNIGNASPAGDTLPLLPGRGLGHRLLLLLHLPHPALRCDCPRARRAVRPTPSARASAAQDHAMSGRASAAGCRNPVATPNANTTATANGRLRP